MTKLGTVARRIFLEIINTHTRIKTETYKDASYAYYVGK
jgi:hypothetical protein